MNTWHLLRTCLKQSRVALRTLVDDTSRQIAVVFGGHLLRLALGLVSSALLARGLGPEGMRVFAVLSAVTSIGVTLADFGLSNSAIRYIAGDLAQSAERARRTANIYGRLKLLGAGLIFVLILLLADPLATILRLPTASGPLLLRLAGLGLLTTALSGLVGTLLRALRRFQAMVLIQLANICLTVLLMGVLFIGNRLDVLSALLVGASTALVTTGLGFLMLSRPWRRALLTYTEAWRQEGRRLLIFGKWLWISAILSILLAQLDLLILNDQMLPQVVGYYALALNLAFKADILNQALHTVLMPEVSALSGRAAYGRHVRRNLVRSGLLGLVLLLALPLARPFILAVYGTAYAPSADIFYALMSVVLFDLVAIPLLLLAFPLNLPRWIVAADVVRIVLLFLVSRALIPAWGVYGPVAGKLVAKVGGALVLGVAIVRRLRATPTPQHLDTLPQQLPAPSPDL